MQPSSFFWNFSYIAGASLRGAVCVTKSPIPLVDRASLCPYPSLPYGKLLDALYMGVPSVSLYGPREDTRRGLSILSQLGLEELATDSREK